MEPTKDNYEPSKAMGAMFDAFELGQKSNSNDMTRLKTELERAQQELQAYRDKTTQLVNLMEEYIRLLGKGLGESASYLDAHGWKYRQYDVEKGIELREKIELQKKLIDTVTPTSNPEQS